MTFEITPKGYFSSINEFKFLKDIGVGSFGKVRLAIHKGSCKYYAIKIIDLNANLTQAELQVIAREIKIHGKIDHPHIIKLWDTLMENNKIYMIMDYAKNGSLFKYHTKLLQEGSKPCLTQTYQFFYQSLQALKYLHSNDIMHRDIKPENLLLDEDLNIKLCDFGWATNQILSHRSTFCGTYEYMAPEMALEISYDFRIDVWALGVLLYELSHGRAPFQAENLKIMKEKISKGSYEINSCYEGSLKNLIVDILQFIPEKRLSIKDIEVHPWIFEMQNFYHDNLTEFGGEENETIHVKIHESNFLSSPILRKHHHHQKSMGNFVITESKISDFGVLNADTGKLTKGKDNFDVVVDNFVSNTKQEQVKKHRRHITQPENEFTEKICNSFKKSMISKKHEIILGSLETEAETPYSNSQIETLKIFSNQEKPKRKFKTQGDNELVKYDSVFPKDHFRLEESLENRKKKPQHQTETGPIISSSSMASLIRNQNNQIKENDFLMESSGKLKRKEKLQEKGHIKIKKSDERNFDIVGKILFDKKKEKNNCS